MFISFSAPTNRNQFSIFDRNQGPLKAIAAPVSSQAPQQQQQQQSSRMPQQPPTWNGQQAMPGPPLPPGGSFVSAEL